jgi:RNA polymerase sigma-70 factor (ECF subfamily)
MTDIAVRRPSPMAFPGSRGRSSGGVRSWFRRLRPVTDTDDELIVAELYRTYHRPLLAFVARLTAGDRQLAEDVVQETMIRAWRNLDRLDAEVESLMPWLATVAKRVYLDHRRYKDSRPPEAGDAPLEHLHVPDETNELLRSVMLSEALEMLTEAHREVLTETILADRTVNQAAAKLGIPVGTVKSRMYYALRALRATLQERGVTA